MIVYTCIWMVDQTYMNMYMYYYVTLALLVSILYKNIEPATASN